jgi:hypothetical protein
VTVVLSVLPLGRLSVCTSFGKSCVQTNTVALRSATAEIWTNNDDVIGSEELGIMGEEIGVKGETGGVYLLRYGEYILKDEFTISVLSASGLRGRETGDVLLLLNSEVKLIKHTRIIKGIYTM